MAKNPIDQMLPEVAKEVATERTVEATLVEATERKLKQIVIIGVDAEGVPVCLSNFTSIRRIRGLTRILDKAARAHEAAEIAKAAEAAKSATSARRSAA